MNLRSRLLHSKAVGIFYLLLVHAPLSRKELATLLKVNDRSHGFSYGFKDLKTKGYLQQSENLETKGLINRLSDKVFLKPEDRPATVATDVKKLKECTMAVQSQKHGKRSREAEKDGQRV